MLEPSWDALHRVPINSSTSRFECTKNGRAGGVIPSNFRLDRGAILVNIASGMRRIIDADELAKILFNALQGFLVYLVTDEVPLF